MKVAEAAVVAEVAVAAEGAVAAEATVVAAAVGVAAVLLNRPSPHATSSEAAAASGAGRFVAQCAANAPAGMVAGVVASVVGGIDCGGGGPSLSVPCFSSKGLSMTFPFMLVQHIDPVPTVYVDR